MQARAVVIGASGFIGTRLVSELHRTGVPVIAMDIKPPRQTLPGVDYHVVDVRSPINAALGQGADVIYNLAAVHTTPGHPDHEYYDTNIAGALNTAAFAEAAGIERIVFTSSISVYGPNEDLLDERSIPQPVSAYGKSKRFAEEIHEQWRAKAPERRLIIARPAVVFGPGEGGNYTRLAKALKGGYFFYPGRRDTIKSGGYVDELVRTFAFALRRNEPRILYNFAYPDHSTTEDIVRAFKDVAGFGASPPTVPLEPLLTAASVFEFASRAGVKTSIHRDRVMKLVKSTRIAPGWLKENGYTFATDLPAALALWRDETQGRFV